MDGQLGGIPAQRGPGDGQSHPALAGERDLPAALCTVVDRCGPVQQVADLPVSVVHQRQRGRSVQGRAVGLGIQLHRQRGRALTGAVRAQVQRGLCPRPVQAAHRPPPVMYADGPAHHVPLGQDGGEGEIQAAQHLSARTGEAVLAGDGRAVLRHGDGVEAQGRVGRAAVEPVLQRGLHLLIGDVGGVAAVGQICVAPSGFISTTEHDLCAPVGAFLLLVIIGVLRSVHQCVTVFNIGVRVVHPVEVTVLHLAVGSDGHRPADGILAALRHLHKGVAVFHKERVVRLSHQLGEPALIAEHNTAHQATGPNAGAFAGIFLQRHGRGALD